LDQGNNNGTVLILAEDESLVGSLLQLFRREKLAARVYSTGRQLLAAALPQGPVCLLACVSGGDKCGLAEYERFKEMGFVIPAVFLGKNSEVRLVVRAMRAGAEDFLPYPYHEAELSEVILRALEQSRRFLKNQDNVLELRRRVASITAREREVVSLVISGMLNKQIAEQIKLALITVKVHRGNAMRKLGARSTAELVRIAREAGLWPTNEEIPPLPLPKIVPSKKSPSSRSRR